MTQANVKICNANAQDRDAILAIHMNAFGVDDGEVIAKLVDEMLDDATGEPMLSLVAEADVELVGHLLFTSARIEPDHGQVSAKILAPRSVVQHRQRQGIGGRLIHAGLRQLGEVGVDFDLRHPCGVSSVFAGIRDRSLFLNHYSVPPSVLFSASAGTLAQGSGTLDGGPNC